MRWLKNPMANAVWMALITAVYAAVFLISAACAESYGPWLSDSWWGAFIRNGGMGWLGLGMLAAAAAVDILSVWRRKNYDEYQILALERLMLVSGLLAVLLLPLSLLLLIFAPQHCIEGMFALLLLHWLALVLLELWYFTRNYGA